MDLNFYSELSDGCPQTVDAEFLDTPSYGGYGVENKVRDFPHALALIRWREERKEKNPSVLNFNLPFQFVDGNDSYLAISGGGHQFLSAAVSSRCHSSIQVMWVVACTQLWVFVLIVDVSHTQSG